MSRLTKTEALFLAGLLFIALATASTKSYAVASTVRSGPACEVIAVKNNAWLIRRDSSVKSSLRAGDLLREGDKIEVMRGNTAELAFDRKRKNVVHIDGGTEVEVSQLYPTAIDVSKGKVYALLENKRADRRFKVMTPTAVASVRGTKFQVSIGYAGTEVKTYEGLVQLSGRKKSSDFETKQFILLGPYQKASIDTSGKVPDKPLRMPETEAREIKQVESYVNATRSTLTASPLTSSQTSPSARRQGSRRGGVDVFEEDEESKARHAKGKIFI